MNISIRAMIISLPLIMQAWQPISAAERTPGSTSGGISGIILERTWCYGSCPVDKLVLRSDGTAQYTGMQNTRITGQFNGRFPTEDFDQLSQWLVSQEYFTLASSYGSNNADTPASVIRVVRGEDIKSVINYSIGHSVQLWGMEKAISAVAADIQWQPDNSGIRGQFFLRDPGGEWRPQTCQPISLSPENQGFTPSGTRQSYAVAPQENGRFEIALAPGTYSVSCGRRPPTQTVTVQADKFTDVSVRVEYTDDNSRKAYTPPPPPPGDGLYRHALLAPAVWLYQREGTTINLGEKVEPVIQEMQLWSDSKDNTTFLFGLTIPYDPVVNPVSHILIVNGKAYRQNGSGSRGRESSRLFFRMDSGEDARRVAEHFTIPIRYFRDPGYQLKVSLLPTKASFGRGEEVTATLQIHNPGTKAVQFSSQSMRTDRHDYYTLSARRNGQRVTDISFAGNRGGRVHPRDLQPGATFVEEKVRLNEWFEFSDPGTYEIHAAFRMDFSDPTSGSWLPVSWTDTAETDFTVVIE